MEGKILIVDDRYGIRVLLHEVFQKEGYQTFQATNGFQALDIVKKIIRFSCVRYEDSRYGWYRDFKACKRN